MTQSHSRLQQWWYTNSVCCYGLLPLAWIYQVLSAIRKWYWTKLKRPEVGEVPVIVVGNIAIGGTGKTPLLIALAKEFKLRGLKVGVISRGYGSRAPQYPFSVTAQTPVAQSGDEALLIARESQCPVVIDPKRKRALAHLLAYTPCDVVLSDDGLQHYALARTVEIAVIDGKRGMANGLCLPAGPLREKPARLQAVDFVVINGELSVPKTIPTPFFTMHLTSSTWRRVIDDKEVELARISALDKVHAVTGIGNPQRFFQSLVGMNVDIVKHPFDDHHPFIFSDIKFSDNLPVVMTSKDAIKCQSLLQEAPISLQEKHQYFYVPVDAKIPVQLVEQLLQALPKPMTLSTQPTETYS